MPNCPRCGSEHVVKNGHIHNGKAKFACKDCRRQFVEHPQQRLISAETKVLIDKLLLERLSQAGIVRATGVSARWLQYDVNAKYAAVPQIADVPVKKSRLIVQADELWSFVGTKENQGLAVVGYRCRDPRGGRLCHWPARQGNGGGFVAFTPTRVSPARRLLHGLLGNL